MLISFGHFFSLRKWLSIIQLKSLFLQRNEKNINYYMFDYHSIVL